MMSRFALVAVLCFTLAFAGCLAARDGERGASPKNGACSLLGHPGQIPSAADATVGNGSRTITLRGESLGPHQGVAAWWFAAPDEIHVLQARKTEGAKVQLRVPPNAAVNLVAGETEWTQEAHIAAGMADLEVLLTGTGLAGTLQGTWTQPVAAAAGPAGGAQWQPLDLPWVDDDHMTRLESLSLALRWDNGAGGGADFGIAVGPNRAGGFHYVNGGYQAAPGPQSETRMLTAAEIGGFGWGNGTRLQVGPSISTGGFSTTGIAYVLAWEATFRVDPELQRTCMRLGDVRAVDATLA